MTPFSFAFERPRFCLLLALLWLPIGLGMALAAPWIALAPTWVVWSWNQVPLAVTLALVVWNFLAALRVVGLTGLPHRAWPYTLAQLALFTLLFFQIACHLGAEHYSWDVQPAWYDWILFSGVHALKAGDLFDFIEAYGIDLQVVQHEGTLTASCLLAFHLILDLFLIAVLFEGFHQIYQANRHRVPTPRIHWSPTGRLFVAALAAGTVVTLGGWLLHVLVDYPLQAVPFAFAVLVGTLLILPMLAPTGEDQSSFLTRYTLAFLIVFFISALWIRPWRWADFYLWPIENLCHVLDVGDGLHLFHWHLSQVPQNLWEGSLTFVCRLLMGFALGGLVGWIFMQLSLRLTGGYGLHRETLEELEQTTTNPRFRSLLQRRLARLRGARVPQAARGWGWCVLVLTVSIPLLVVLARAGWPAWDRAAERLADPAGSLEHPQRSAALAALRRLGPTAGGIADRLTAALPRTVPDHQKELLETLTYLGPNGRAVLGEFLQWADPALALACLPTLEARGSSLAGVIARGMGSSSEEVKQAAEATVLRLGYDAMPTLIETLTRENALNLATLFRQLDPEYWLRYSSSNPVYGELVAAAQALPGTTGPIDPVDVVRSLGWARPTLETIVRRLDHPEAEVRRQALLDFQAGSQFEGPGVRNFLLCCADRDLTVRMQAQQILQTLPAEHPVWQRPEAGQALLALVRFAYDADSGVQQGARVVLAHFDPPWQQDAQVLPLLLAFADSVVVVQRRLAASDLAQAELRAGGSVLPTLVRLLADGEGEVRQAAFLALLQWAQRVI